MGTLCKRTGPDIYVSTKDVILEGVRSNLERKPIGEASVSEQEQAEKLAEKLAGTSPKVHLKLLHIFYSDFPEIVLLNSHDAVRFQGEYGERRANFPRYCWLEVTGNVDEVGWRLQSFLPCIQFCGFK